MENVFFSRIDAGISYPYQLENLIEKSNIFSQIEAGRFVAVKIRVQDAGNIHRLDPLFIRVVSEKIKEKGAYPFLIDTTSYYSEKRRDALGLLKVAQLNGYAEQVTGVPFFAADGLGLQEGYPVISDGLLKETYIPYLLNECDYLVVLSDCKADPHTGFSGALKNIGAGLTTKKTKLKMHRTVSIKVDDELCDGCEECMGVCALRIPKIINAKAVIEEPACVRCSKCLKICPQKAIKINNLENLQLAVSSSARSIVNEFEGRVLFINSAVNISSADDFSSVSGNLICDDIGFFASYDPVSCDKAFLDTAGVDLFIKKHGIDPLIQVMEAEKISAGTTNYNLVEIANKV